MILRRAVVISLIVGPILTIINQYDALLGTAALNLWTMGLTFLVPLCVSLVTAAASRGMSQEEPVVTAPSVDCPRGGPEVSVEALRELDALISTVGENAAGVNRASCEREEYLQEFLRETLASRREAEAVQESAQQSSERLDEACLQADGVMASMEATAEELSGGVDTADLARQALDTFNARFEQISGMAEQIRAIAKSTNMLALNARVEAARAGDSGKGFAVVAEQVHGLAGECGEAASSITAGMGELGESVEAVVRHVENLSKRMTRLGGIVREAGGHAESIKDVLEASGHTARTTAGQAAEQTRSVDRTLTRLERLIEDTREAIGGSRANMEMGRDLARLIHDITSADGLGPARHAAGEEQRGLAGAPR